MRWMIKTSLHITEKKRHDPSKKLVVNSPASYYSSHVARQSALSVLVRVLISLFLSSTSDNYTLILPCIHE